ncbi:hypothetical protein RRX38_20805 [Pseudomonas sp. DTU_2021_1001937_2_SI_NGA_ILE_001]|uniref:hypothetical protein n=1 Tax=Pseudomonas sp. DTU_2021_1001937_2_SI_NGA_ILE_001 TaxID=3077589 RepID=UPI0028FC1961|nr:hypothetical protein [Pseudomonas sp. DTU_2021_1001937_2_SI_NGA_ILE_001]WNW13493.1 hypothetical protein RRX38_20805 [Pseudomonas sp. DTU_2021_1001937_2_SI_NGA_ILE_001]
MTTDDTTLLPNVTCLGPRAKKPTVAKTGIPTSPFANLLQAAEGKYKTAETNSTRGSAQRQWLMEKANRSPQEAAELAHGYAYHSLNGQGIDLTDYPVIRYCATGEIVTDESSSGFESYFKHMQLQRSALYESELLKGTPPAQILEKILDFNDSQPKRFRDMANW